MFIFGLCDILLCLHSFACWRVLDVCHDILITTLSFLGQQKCFCNNSADIKLKFFPLTTARGREQEGCTSVLITMSSCQQENQVQRHDWRQEKIHKRMKKLRINFRLKSQFRTRNFGSFSAGVNVFSIEWYVTGSHYNGRHYKENIFVRNFGHIFGSMQNILIYSLMLILDNKSIIEISDIRHCR